LDYVTNNIWVVVSISALNGTNIEKVVDWLIEKSKK